MVKNENYFEILRKLEKNPQSNQRELTNQSGISIDKLNYCLKALKKKRQVKIKNFKKKLKKINCIYVSTLQSITTKTRLTIAFMKRKLAEYKEHNKELKLQKNNDDLLNYD